MSDPANTLVEEELSKEFIYMIGVYVQSCARIEKLIVRCICVTEGLTGEVEDTRHAQLSNFETRKLISSLKTMTENLPANHSWHGYFEELRHYLHQFVDRRHKAVHGLVTDQNGLEVVFFDKKAKETKTLPFQACDLQEMVEHADQIAKNLMRYLSDQRT